ncbi:MAG TPA: M20/M25/M40 family metallo-hydrolase [Thermoanaerobaculia bacterium]|nr:M20/M25/M40 family metallo-hydrolase [Thermoanaerobaculia bacterium]
MPRWPRLGAFTLALPALAAAASSSLAPVEHRLVRSIEANRAGAEALLERAVDVNSGTMNFEGVREVGAIFRKELDALGFRTRWIDGAPFGRAGHLVAEHPGEGRPILLIGHLDTVFEKDSPFQRFERLPGGRARGPGVIDMKGGDVVVLLALGALRDAGALDRMNLSLIFTGDEEKAGEPLALARRDLLDLAARCEVAVGFEDGAGRPGEAVTARRGASDWVLRVTGRPAHSSQIFGDEVGAGAIFEAARILDGFYRALSGERYLTISPGAIVGGTTAAYDPAQNRGEAFGKTNVVAGTAQVQGDLRTVSPSQLATAKERMRGIAAAHLPRTNAELEFRDGYPPMAPTGGNAALLALYDRASRDLGLGPVAATDPMRAGAADAAFAAEKVKMAIDGIGLCGTDDHTDRETADLATLPTQAERAALLLLRLSGTR